MKDGPFTFIYETGSPDTGTIPTPNLKTESKSTGTAKRSRPTAANSNAKDLDDGHVADNLDLLDEGSATQKLEKRPAH